MNLLPPRWFVPCLLAGGLLVSGLRADNPFALFSAPSGDVFIVTDVTPEGKGFRPPTRESPIYCEAVDFGCSFGSEVGDRLPDATAMRQLIVKLLADEGYRGSSEKNPPQLLLTFQWGSLRGDLSRNLHFLGGDKLDLMWELESMPWINPRVLTRGMRDARAQKVMDIAQDDLYVATICGFDYAAYKAGEAKLLWKTRIACSTIGLSMRTALPEMITMAAPAVGRETRSVIIANPRDAREGRIVFGELQVIDDEDDAQPAREEEPPTTPVETTP